MAGLYGMLKRSLATATKPGAVKKAALVTPLTVTATTGTLPTPNGTTVVANAATPTVVELLELAIENKAKIDALTTALQNAGIMSTT